MILHVSDLHVACLLCFMYRHDVGSEGQDAAGLDMFVGSGIDFLSEVNIEDMDMDLFNSNTSPSGQLSPESFMNYAPLAASLGPPVTGLRFGLEAGLSTSPFPHPLYAPAGRAQSAGLSLGM